MEKPCSEMPTRNLSSSTKEPLRVDSGTFSLPPSASIGPSGVPSGRNTQTGDDAPSLASTKIASPFQWTAVGSLATPLSPRIEKLDSCAFDDASNRCTVSPASTATLEPSRFHAISATGSGGTAASLGKQ